MADPIVIDIGDGSDDAIKRGFDAASVDLTNAVADVLEHAHPGLFGGERLEGGTMQQAPVRIPQQLTFDIGGEAARPTGASFTVSGRGDIRNQMFMGDDVTVRVIAADGEIIADFDGSVTNVAFKQHDATDTNPAWVERAHTIKLGDSNDA